MELAYVHLEPNPGIRILLQKALPGTKYEYVACPEAPSFHEAVERLTADSGKKVVAIVHPSKLKGSLTLGGLKQVYPRLVVVCFCNQTDEEVARDHGEIRGDYFISMRVAESPAHLRAELARIMEEVLPGTVPAA
ncbi:MAG TPA: hypothetical protein VLA04_04860 [Verrucomicrobiae bacterium]|nr:hypothetical protein [Verrucomicrobiae bacterium]